MKRLDLATMLISLAVILPSCSFNVSMAHTEGKANDVIDDNATNTPNIAPTVSTPI